MRKIVLMLCLCLAPVAPGARAEVASWMSRDDLDLYFRWYAGHVPLSHIREAKQRRLFSHLVDPRNLSRILGSRAPRDEKLQELRIMLALIGAYRSAYQVAVVVGEPLAEELARVQAYTLEVAGALASLLGPAAAEEAASSAWVAMLEGALLSMNDRAGFTPAQAALMADAMARQYPGAFNL